MCAGQGFRASVQARRLGSICALRILIFPQLFSGSSFHRFGHRSDPVALLHSRFLFCACSSCSPARFRSPVRGYRVVRPCSIFHLSLLRLLLGPAGSSVLQARFFVRPAARFCCLRVQVQVSFLLRRSSVLSPASVLVRSLQEAAIFALPRFRVAA